MNKFLKSLLVASATLLLGLTSCNNQSGRGNTSGTDYGKYVTSVTLNHESAELDVGGSLQLIPTITWKDDKVYEQVTTKWITSDGSIVSVNDNGFVTALKSGKANISFRAGHCLALCSIKVLGGEEPGPGPGPDPETFTITLNASSLMLEVEDTVTLVATLSSPALVTWNSSAPTVASVDNSGLVTALSEGRAIISASANGVTATCTVDVSEEEYTCTVYFFIDYNNIDEFDTTGTKLLSKFSWYGDRPLSEAPAGSIPANPTTPLDPAFPVFIGWSSHTIIDTTDDLWDLDNDLIGNDYFLFLYGIWVEA